MEEAYFKTEEGRKAQVAADPKNVAYHADLFRFLRLDFGAIENRRYLDVGCARGALMRHFEALGFEAFGCDISRYGVEECLKHFPRGRVALADAADSIPLEGRFGVMTCLGVLGLVPLEKQEPLLRNCFDKLGDGGLFVATAPNAGRPSVARKITHMENSYKNARDREGWLSLARKLPWKSVSVDIVQKLPFANNIAGRNIFVKTRFGDPAVIVGKK